MRRSGVRFSSRALDRTPSVLASRSHTRVCNLLARTGKSGALVRVPPRGQAGGGAHGADGGVERREGGVGARWVEGLADERVGVAEAVGEGAAEVVGAADEAVLVGHAVVPQNTVEELGATVEAKAVLVSAFDVDGEIVEPARVA